MNPPEPQMAIRFSEVREPESCWLGLATDNRRLFDALQDGWLRPQSSDGQMIGIGNVRSGWEPGRCGASNTRPSEARSR